ncbi:MAG: hypothetical protein AVDCRST_MAG70-2375, partial [uncultured Thermomicrobiales bacterium]
VPRRVPGPEGPRYEPRGLHPLLGRGPHPTDRRRTRCACLPLLSRYRRPGRRTARLRRRDPLLRRRGRLPRRDGRTRVRGRPRRCPQLPGHGGHHRAVRDRTRHRL